MKRENAIKPLAERIDSFPPRRTVIYRCFKCDASFAMLGEHTKYCHNCGTKVDWDGVLTRLSKNFSSIYVYTVGSKMDIDEFERQFIDELNVKQLGPEFADLYNEDKSPKNCDQCIHAAGTEGCLIPEDEREIILIPRRLNYCNSAICNKFKENEKQ